MADWTKCPAVESHTEKKGGAWIFTGTRIPIAALFENLKDGVTVREFVEWFPGVELSQYRKCSTTRSNPYRPRWTLERPVWPRYQSRPASSIFAGLLKGGPALVDSTIPRRGERARYCSAVCLETGDVEGMELDGNCRAETSAAFLGLLRQRHSEQRNVIRANAPAHRDEAVREYFRKPGLLRR